MGEREYADGAFYWVRYCGEWTVGRYRAERDHLGGSWTFHLLGGNGNAWCLVNPTELQEIGRCLGTEPSPGIPPILYKAVCLTLDVVEKAPLTSPTEIGECAINILRMLLKEEKRWKPWPEGLVEEAKSS